MASPYLTVFKRLSELPEPIAQCCGVIEFEASPSDSWQGGLLALDTVVYESGRIARKGDLVRHHVDPDELARCRALAEQAASIDCPGLGSEAHFEWQPFFMAANSDESPPERIDEALIRQRFGGTILPIAPLLTTPIRSDGPWWDMMSKDYAYYSWQYAEEAKVANEVWVERSVAGARALEEHGLWDYAEDEDQQKVGDPILAEILGVPLERLTWGVVGTTLSIFRLTRITRFFNGPQFRDACLVAIGDYFDHRRVPQDRWPTGLRGWPTNMPRLAVGLTPGGSLAGLIGYVVET